ncbi:hypothetical protein Q5741_07980 [Paenibacillus sp. JX-17]|uniref:DUF5668 domain-containing protein n=1 Tax=Paenibacillus lacisoli TaxID=3064525 RepID=A0ABT9CBV8_9BACL|nr:hypothetical protein [Paenibacillus sp. JX-17]MDO7906355.1 hypothetical protein [Paenibacillus sp. JX-17]
MNKRMIAGTLMLLLGVCLFLNQGESFGTGKLFGYFWPVIFVIPLGLFFHWMYFSMTDRRGTGLLIPGGILLVAGLVCQYSMLFDAWHYMWPGFILAAAVGLFEFYWFGTRNRWLLIPINILTVASLLFFAVFTLGSLFSQSFAGQPWIAFILVAAGAGLLFMKRKPS